MFFTKLCSNFPDSEIFNIKKSKFAFVNDLLNLMKGILFIIFLAASLFSCQRDMTEVDKLFTFQNRPDEKGLNVKSFYSDSAVVYFMLESIEMFTIRNQTENYIEYPKGIKISFLDRKRNPTSWLTADRAINDLNVRKFIAKGNVSLFNRNNDKLQTAELIWDEQNEKLFTNKFVKITQPSKGDTLYGYGFESNSAFSEFEIKKKFSGKVIENMISDFN